MPKALVLLSGGLDSILVLKILEREKIDITALHFVTGLETATVKSEILNIEGKNYPKMICDKYNIKLKVVSLQDKYLDMFFNPQYGGYGSAVNPCLDCHILMLQEAKKIMKEEGFDFIATGEVLGQRPMSQLSNKLKIVTEKSGLEGYLLRPLSAKLLDITIAEESGLINRDNLYAIEGRSRTTQIILAKEFGINDYPEPAGGGCVILDKVFAKKYYDLISFVSKDKITMDVMKYLAIGRHFRLNDKLKLIVGRDEKENDAIENRNDIEGVLLKPTYRRGPNAFIEIWDISYEITDDIIYDSAMIVAGYSKEDVDVFNIKIIRNKNEKNISVSKDKIDIGKYNLII